MTKFLSDIIYASRYGISHTEDADGIMTQTLEERRCIESILQSRDVPKELYVSAYPSDMRRLLDESIHDNYI